MLISGRAFTKLPSANARKVAPQENPSLVSVRNALSENWPLALWLGEVRIQATERRHSILEGTVGETLDFNHA